LIRATTSGREIAEAQIAEARAGRMPLLQFNETLSRSNNPVFVFGSLLEQGRFGSDNFALPALNSPNALTNFRTSLVFRLPIFDQRQTETRISQAEIGRGQADAQIELTRQRVRFETVQAFYGLLVAQAKKDVSDEAVLMAQADLKRVRDLFDAGMVVASDVLAVQVQLAEFRQQQIQAGGDLITAQASLNAALGLPVETPQRVAGELVKTSFGVVTQEELIRQAIERRPDLASARLSVNASKERVRGARGELLPRVEMFGGFGLSGNRLNNGSSDYTVGASITFNLLDSGRNARLNQARAAEVMAAADQEHQTTRIRLEVVRAYQQYVSARERLAVAGESVEHAGEALRIVRDRYQEGLTTVTEVLRAETTFVRARAMLLAARHDHYVGYAGLMLATGSLTDVSTFVS
jgi:outer membrane protein TolC